MRVSRLPVTLLCALLFAGCAYRQVGVRTMDLAELPPPGEKVAVLLATDVTFQNDKNEGVGRQLSVRTLEALRTRFALAQLLEETDEDRALATCRDRGVKYLVAPTILHWEERATNWSGRRDKIRVQVRLLRVEPVGLVKTVTFEAKNSYFTFVDRSAAELLDDEFSGTVLSLFH